MNPVKLIILGAGSRGSGYAKYTQINPQAAVVVGAAEPRRIYREKMASEYHLTVENTASDWRELAARPKFADAVIISTPDQLHAEPAIAFAEKGYAILLEKPMAPNAADCKRIYAAVKKAGSIFAVCHVMRYTRYTQKVKEILDSGVLGEIVSIEHTEPVGYWHMAHSFVRGNWRNEGESSFMLLAKSCHDIDWLRYVTGRRCLKVSSFGSLSHFKKDQKPVEAGSALRCLDCAYEARCPYSAPRLYLGKIRSGEMGWPVDVITADLTEKGVMQALKDGPYGRCVYECDNDVVDHQVVNLLYEGGVTASFNMIAFDKMGGRRTTIFGTQGELRGDGDLVSVYDFLTETSTTFDTRSQDSAASGHGGGDYALMDQFVRAVATGDQNLILSGLDETLESHLTVFAAEQSRVEGKTVEVNLD